MCVCTVACCSGRVSEMLNHLALGTVCCMFVCLCVDVLHVLYKLKTSVSSTES